MTTEGMTPKEKLDDFLGGIQPGMAGMEVRLIPHDVPLDFSRESLPAVERSVLDNFTHPAELDVEGDEWVSVFVHTVTGYLGETLLRATGGHWIWNDDPNSPSYGLPVIVPDEVLGLGGGSPRHLMAEAILNRDGHQFEHAYDEWHGAAERYRAEHPGWTPVKERTPGLDPVGPDTTGYLDAWLTERRLTFDRWIARYGGDATWDFSPESLDALQDLVLRTVSTREELESPEHRDFTEGAIWYYGEVMCTADGVEWKYQPGEREPDNPYRGHVYVEKRGRKRLAMTPLLSFVLLLREPEPGYLREDFSLFAR